MLKIDFWLCLVSSGINKTLLDKREQIREKIKVLGSSELMHR